MNKKSKTVLSTPPLISSTSLRAIPKVSVALITYNHEKFIAQAVESVLMQQTDFDYELVIGEDCSTDNTRAILLLLQKKYPEKINLFLNEYNLGPGMNIKHVLKECKGEYLAILEGDDFWTSPKKLQVQIDLLQRNLDWSICTHRIEVFFEDRSLPSYLAPRFDPKPVSTINDLAHMSFVGTSAAVYRNLPNANYPDWIFKVDTIDYALALFYASRGKIGFIDEVMCAYRKHNNSMWFPIDPINQRTKLARSLLIISKNLPRRYRQLLKNQAAQALLKNVKNYLENNNSTNAQNEMGKILRMPSCIPVLPRQRFLRFYLMVFFPWIIPILKKIKYALSTQNQADNQ